MAGSLVARRGRQVEHAFTLSVDHKTAAHRVVLARGDLGALRIHRMEGHAVGVQRQALAAKQQVIFGYKRHRVRAQQHQCLPAADIGDGGGDLVGVDAIRLMPRQAQQHGFVGAVAHAGGRQ